MYICLLKGQKTEEISNRMDKIYKAIEVRVMNYFKDKEEKERKKLNIIGKPGNQEIGRRMTHKW